VRQNPWPSRFLLYDVKKALKFILLMLNWNEKNFFLFISAIAPFRFLRTSNFHLLLSQFNINILVGYIITCMLDKLELDKYYVIDINIA